MVNYFNVEAIENAKPVLLMIVVQSIYAASGIMLKMVAADGGLGVLIAYRFVFSSLFVVPFALLYERYLSFTFPPFNITCRYSHFTQIKKCS